MKSSTRPPLLDVASEAEVPTDVAGATSRESFTAMLRQLREDYWTHGSEWRSPGFQTLLGYRFGAWLLQAPPTTRRALWGVYRMLYVRARNVYGIELPAAARVGRRVRFPHQSGIVIHWNAVIGDDCVIRQNVTLGAVNAQRIEGAPTLGRNVEVGAGAAIVGRVTVGDGARIGPNAVILTRIPAGATVVAAGSRVVQLAPRPGPNAPDDTRADAGVTPG